MVGWSLQVVCSQQSLQLLQLPSKRQHIHKHGVVPFQWRNQGIPLLALPPLRCAVVVQIPENFPQWRFHASELSGWIVAGSVSESHKGHGFNTKNGWVPKRCRWYPSVYAYSVVLVQREHPHVAI